MSTITIIIEPCAQCGAPMSISSTRVEDDFTTGIIEATCPNCGFQVIIMAETEAIHE